MTAWTGTETGLALTVRVTPKASRTGFAGLVSLADGRKAFAIRLAAPPVEGAANAELVAFLAKTLGLRKSAVTIASGETGRLKLVKLEGDAADIVSRLEALI